MNAVARERQPSKAYPSIFINECGKFISHKELQPTNAKESMATILFDIDALLSEVQDRNAPHPIEVTLSGITRVDTYLFSLKASLPMVVT